MTMITLTRAINSDPVLINKTSIAMVEVSPASAKAGAVLTVAGEKVAVLESFDQVAAELGK